MREKRTIVDGADFEKIFQFQYIFSAIGSSMQPARLFVALCMVVVLLAVGHLWDSTSGIDATNLDGQSTSEAINEARALAIAKSITALGLTAPSDSEHWTVRQAQSNLLEKWQDYLYEGDVTEQERIEFELIYLELEQVRPRGPFESSASFVSRNWNQIVGGAIELNVVQMWQGVVSIVWELPQLLWNSGFHWFISLYGFLLIYVLCIGGGAISRMQAVQHSRSQSISVSDAVDFSVSRWRTLLMSIFGPAMFIAVITIILMVMGLLLLNIPWLNMIGGLFYGVALLLGFLVTLVAVGCAACFPMFIPAVVIENCGGGEAVQRSFSYLISKTLRFIFYLFPIVFAIC